MAANAPEQPERKALVDNGHVGTYVKQTGVADGGSCQNMVYELGSKGEGDVVFSAFSDI